MVKHSLGTAFPATSEWQRADRTSVPSSRASVHRCLQRVKVTFLLQPSACPPQAPDLLKWARCTFLGEIPSLACSRAELEHESLLLLHRPTGYGRVITIIHGVLPQKVRLVLRYSYTLGHSSLSGQKVLIFTHCPPPARSKHFYQSRKLGKVAMQLLFLLYFSPLVEGLAAEISEAFCNVFISDKHLPNRQEPPSLAQPFTFFSKGNVHDLLFCPNLQSSPCHFIVFFGIIIYHHFSSC